MNDIEQKTNSNLVLEISNSSLMSALENSVYPGASRDSIALVLDYCRAAKLDPLQKPVHIVGMWDPKSQRMKDVIMPGINLYRIQASRSGEMAGVSEPDFGPDITENIGGTTITYPKYCKVMVKRKLKSGEIVEFTAKEFWKENYAARGGKDKSIAPNMMWSKRPYGQLAKCAQAQALRMAFPEIAGNYSAEEMEGKSFFEKGLEQEKNTEKEVNARFEQDNEIINSTAGEAAYNGLEFYQEYWSKLTAREKNIIGRERHEKLKKIAAECDEEQKKEEDNQESDR